REIEKQLSTRTGTRHRGLVESEQGPVRAPNGPALVATGEQLTQRRGEVGRTGARVGRERAGGGIVEPLPRVLEVDHLAPERVESLQVLEVVPRDPAHGV